jgi:hypothetical protein
MGVLGIIQLILSLLGGVSSALGKAGLTEAAAGIQAAIAKLEEVHGSLVTEAQVESLKITPIW